MHQDEIMDSLLEKVSDNITSLLKDILTEVLQTEIQKNLTRAMVDSEFYRALNDELRSGLKQIRQEINQARGEGPDNGIKQGFSSEQTEEIFNEASDQLDQIFKTTEQATEEIMDLVEQDVEHQENVEKILSKGTELTEKDLQQLHQINQKVQEDLVQIMTKLSFQDLTGQRLKRVISALRKIEDIVLNLFISSGLSMKVREEHPEKSFEEIKQEAEQKTKALKGPQADPSQGDVDDLLKQLGLE